MVSALHSAARALYRIRMSADRSRPILVAGGGIGGLAAALALARAGWRARVLEQAAEFREIGAGIQLGPNVFRMFERLGVKDAMMALAHVPRALVMKDALSGEEVKRIPLGEGFRRRFGQPYAVIHRADMHRVLLDACRGAAAIELLPATRATSFVDDGERVLVRAADGATHEGAALIGCDGLWSMVREALLGDGPPRVSGHIAYRAVLKRQDVPDHLWNEDVTLWAGPRTHLVQYPLRCGELFNLVAVFHSDRYEEGWDAYGDPEELHARFTGQRPEVLSLLERIESWRMWVLCDREPVKRWSRGRVTLLGDAAHPMLQYLAQGANMACEDAVRLADELERAGGDFAASFRAYEEARYLRTGRVQLTARFYGEIYHASGVAADLRRELIGGGTPESAWEGMAWLYDGP